MAIDAPETPPVSREELNNAFPDGQSGSGVLECPTKCQKAFDEAMKDVKKAEKMTARDRNHFINKKYEDLYNAGVKDFHGNVKEMLGSKAGSNAIEYKSPNLWVGMATMVSAQVGCLMDFSVKTGAKTGGAVGAGGGLIVGAGTGAALGSVFPGVGTVVGGIGGGIFGLAGGSATGVGAGAGYGYDTQALLGEGNLNLFRHMYPPMHMLSKLGYEDYLKCVEELKKNDKCAEWDEAQKKDFAKHEINGKNSKYNDVINLGEAVEKMRDGNLHEAANMIINYEQLQIADPWYQDNPKRFGLIKAVGAAYKKVVGHDPQSIPLSKKCNSGRDPVPFTGDLTKGVDRLAYFWELYKQWNGYINND